MKTLTLMMIATTAVTLSMAEPALAADSTNSALQEVDLLVMQARVLMRELNCATIHSVIINCA
jgi:hypothetical protein